MMKLFKKLAVVVLLGGLLLTPRYAGASIVFETVGSWGAATNQQVQILGENPIWTFISSDLDIGTELAFTGNGDVHSLNINRAFYNSNPISPDAYSLKYSIEIDPAISPTSFFERVRLESTLGGAGGGDPAVVTKSIYTDAFDTLLDTLVSTNASTATTANLLGKGLTKLWIHETFLHTDPKNTIFSTTDTYVQAIPEPASLAIWSLLAVGGAAAAASRRRRRGSWSDESRVAIRNVIEGK